MAKNKKLTGVDIIRPKRWVEIKPKIEDAPFVLEGAIFDRQGNLYVCSVFTGEVFKVPPKKKKAVRIFYDPTKITMCSAVGVHKDGKLFLSTFQNGKIVSINPDGTDFQEVLTQAGGENIVVDDLVFDSDGNFYFTQATGNLSNPTGKIYYVSLENPAEPKTELVAEGFAFPNGIALTTGIHGAEKRLLVSQTLKNTVVRLDLAADSKFKLDELLGIGNVSFINGFGLDSNVVDVDGNLYQTVYGSGKIVIINGTTFDVIAEVRVPGREKGKGLSTTSVAIRPGTKKGYMTVSGKGGAWIYTFDALGKGMTPAS